MSVVSNAIRQQIRQRANYRCEYCRKADFFGTYGFHVDHIIAQKHDGLTVFDNLVWACYECNICKGTDIASYDSLTGDLTRFFNPRNDKWDEHFSLEMARLVGLTPIGRVTIRLLQMNDPSQIEARRSMIDAGLW